MVFSSIVFIFTFLPLVILAYYLAPVKLRNLVLLLASLVFYAWGEPVYIFLMLYSILFNYVMGLDIARQQEKGKRGRGSLMLGVAVNLLLLGFFKYYGFLAENVSRLLSLELPAVSLGLIPGQGEGTEKSHLLRTLYFHVSSACGRAHRSVCGY